MAFFDISIGFRHFAYGICNPVTKELNTEDIELSGKVIAWHLKPWVQSQYHINKNKESKPRGTNILTEYLAMDGFKVLEVKVPKMWFVNLMNCELAK